MLFLLIYKKASQRLDLSEKKEEDMVDITYLDIDKVTTCASLSTGTSHTTKTILAINASTHIKSMILT